MRPWSRPICILMFGLLFGCAEPPSKEMHQAQGAIDAARAAGAQQYATAEIGAAVDALARSEQAVVQRDYRLALNLAIDSRERAQNAVKLAVEARARARGDAERAIAEVSTLLIQARERMRDPPIGRLPRRSLQGPRTTIQAAQQSLQEARTALNADDYPTAIRATQGVAARLHEALAIIDQAPAGQDDRRRP